jgi:Mannosyltransferase (PIG-V)
VRPGRGSWPFVLAVWGGSRLLFLVAGALGFHLLRHAGAVGFPREPGGVLNYWAHWDGGWFSAIARYGYGATVWPASTNFFPLYPLTIRGGVLLGAGAAVSGVVISLAASLAALYFLHELARDIFDARAARAATVALAVFPTAFFLNAVYSEALFLAAAIGAVWVARVHGDFLIAALLGCLAAATRNVGVFLLFPLADEWLRRRRRGAATWPELAVLGLVPSGLLAYMFWLWHWSSHPLLFATVVRQTWGRKLTSPVDTVERAWHAAVDGAAWAVHPGRLFATSNPNGSFHALETFNFVFFVLLALLLVGVLVRLPRGLALYALAAAALPFLTPPPFSPLASLPRYFLGVFPAFLVLGDALARSRIALAGWLTASVALGILLTLEFTTWRWVI